MTKARETLLTQEEASISLVVAIRLQANYHQALGFNHAAILVIEDGLHIRTVAETVPEMEACLNPFPSIMRLAHRSSQYIKATV